MSAWNPQANDIFLNALDIAAPADRRAYVQQACRDDAELLAQVQSLVEASKKAGSFLENPALAEADPTIGQPLREATGSQIGPYKILQQIGEGGMGVVYMAEQTEPVQRRVALKIIKPGMDSRQVIARFAAEKQALALMDHVNIARVLDAGVTEQGRPYFVMDLIHGVPITKYCDDNHLTPRHRLELFVPVCQAIQHAHQKGIIHRDIKPSNVMITLYDGKPVPKVIDFGVAKAIDQKLTEQTLFTQYGTMVGTLEYMSPEQAEMSALGVDTRSDIYSLGVLLYELLTGSTPLSRQQMKEAAYGEILRLIRDVEPPKPSTRLSDSGEALASISALRQTEPAKLSKLMRGELDWIVMKTLEKDRNRRYDSASNFSADVERYLNDETVQACPPSAIYRFRKFARRNRSTLLTALTLFIALLVLVAGLAQSNIWVIAERNEKAQALKEREIALGDARASAAEAEAASKRTKKNFLAARVAIREVITKAALGDGEWSQLPLPLRKKFSEESARFYLGLIHDSTEQGDRFETAIAYRTLAVLHGRAGTGMEDVDKAEDCFRKSIAILDELSNAYPNESEYRDNLALCELQAGHLLLKKGKATEAEKAYRKTVALQQSLAETFPQKLKYCLELGRAHNYVGLTLHGSGRCKEAEQEHRQAIRILERLAKLDDPVSGHWHRMELGWSHVHLGGLLLNMGQTAEAEPEFRAVLALGATLAVENPTDHTYQQWMSDAHSGLRKLYASTNRPDEAVREAWQAIHMLQPCTDPSLQLARANHYNDLAFLLCSAKRLPEAEEAAQAGLKLKQELTNKFPKDPAYRFHLAHSYLGVAFLVGESARMSESVETYGKAESILKKLTENASEVVVLKEGLGHAIWQLADAWLRLDRLDDAERANQMALIAFHQLAADRPANAYYRQELGFTRRKLADVAERAGRMDDAVSHLQESARHYEKLVAEQPNSSFYRQEAEHVRARLSGLLLKQP